MDAVAMADRDFEGESKEALPTYDKFFVSYEKWKVSCLIEFYGCCGFLVLLHSSGARVNGEAGIGTNALWRKVTDLGRSVRLELETQTRG